jgi:membrane protein implicated in regulation of membrane protease activity
MLTGTLVFLVIGGVGLAVLALGLIGGQLLGLLDVGIDATVSTETVAGFLGVFGFGSAVVSTVVQARTPGELALSAAVGLAAAVPATFLVARLSRAARDMPTDDTPSRSDLLGSLGVVVSPIPAAGYGEVRVRLGGHVFKLNARADQPIASGVQILVVEVPTDTSAVVIEAPGAHGSSTDS